MRGTLIALAAIALVVAGCGARTDAEAWCTDTRNPGGGPTQVIATANAYLGIQWSNSDTRRDDARQDPRWGAACAVAYELIGLSQDEWNWCFDDGNRRAFLEPAVIALGMGEDEAAGTDGFGEAPGDTPAEYAGACRLSYVYWRVNGIHRLDQGQLDALFGVTGEVSGWCATNVAAVTQAKATLGIESAPTAQPVERFVGEARACRFANLVGIATGGT